MNPEVALPQKKSPAEYRRAAKVRDALGVTEGKAEREELSTVPFQSAETVPEATGRAGRKLGITDEDIQRRNEYIIGLALMGLTVRTILQRVNAQAAVTGWGIIESEKTIHRIVSEHYQEVRLKHAGDVQAFEQGLREAAYESMCQTLERMVTYVEERSRSTDPKDKWRAFEYVSAQTEIARLQQLLIDNRNWNGSKTNPTFVAVQQNNSQVNVFDTAHRDLIASQRDPALQALIDKAKASIASQKADG